jgi:hypothetical protein
LTNPFFFLRRFVSAEANAARRLSALVSAFDFFRFLAFGLLVIMLYVPS